MTLMIKNKQMDF